MRAAVECFGGPSCFPGVESSRGAGNWEGAYIINRPEVCLREMEVGNGYLCRNRSLGEKELRMDTQNVLDCALQGTEWFTSSQIP